MSLIDLESNLDSMFYIDNEWICETDTGLSTSNKNNYNVIILNDRLMSETVQTEHSYFTNHNSFGNQLTAYADDDSNDTHSFKGWYFYVFSFSFFLLIKAAELIVTNIFFIEKKNLF